jgi:hypothetical protein
LHPSAVATSFTSWRVTSALTAVNQSVTDSDATHSFSVFLKPIGGLFVVSPSAIL